MNDVLALSGLGAIFLAIVLGVSMLVTGSSRRENVAKAMESIDRMYAPGTAPPTATTAGDRNLPPVGQRIAGLGRTLTPQRAIGRLQRWLDYAGNPPGWPAERLMEWQGIGLLGGAALGFLFGLAVSDSIAWLVVWTVIGAAIGFWLPFIIVYDLGLRRQTAIRRQLPDALDLLTLSVEAGLGFDAAVAQIATTLPGEVAREFARMLHEMQMGQRRADALRALGARTSVLELRTVATALLQATELGIPIADVLREQAREMRVKRRQNAEAAAAKVPVKVVFPLVLCLLPALFVVVIGPGVIRILDAFLG
ncbi:MAG: type II secretion system F family protein [Hamadaea sp.]|uniref:type II secretion system F family protein n=1 Tax=Hamadaea sp. TaxID=2024425 RepID=UPI0017A0B323|nr:type II secretion system F family protein [Hamadaea sp.]NUR71212.1 type II secretion system F family protein [Hamadaea sp.]NUT17743.1 type II secretion system F family protein [Hamadaea sp.]